jgi:hypothetical protein
MHVFCNLEDAGDDLPPFCDMTFGVVDKVYDERTSTWHLSVRADATPYEPVGFAVDIPTAGWTEQVDGDEDDAFHSFWGPVTLRTRGEDSDRLLALMADYYGIESSSKGRSGWLSKLSNSGDALLRSGWTFPQSIECLAVGIESNPALIAEQPVRMKLFFDDGMEDSHYAEVFLNMDLPHGLCGLNEKDEEYRADLIHWLSKQGSVNANPHRQEG